MTHHEVDPEIKAMVLAVRDRFGVNGLRQAARAVEEEIERYETQLREAFAAEEERSS